MKKTVSNGHSTVSGAKPLPPQQQRFVTGIIDGLEPSESARRAGYASKGKGTYGPAKAASVLLSKIHVRAALEHATMAQAIKDGGQVSTEWLRGELIKGVARPLRQTQVDCLLALVRLHGETREEAKPSDADPPRPMSDVELHSKIAELEAQLKPIRESVHPEMVIGRTLSEMLNDQQSTRPLTQVLKDHPLLPQTPCADTPEPLQDAKDGLSESGGEAKAAAPVVNNLVATEPDEKTAECPHGHGQYLARRDRQGHFSFCPVCTKESDDREKWFGSLAPAGDNRPENRGMPPGHMLHRRY